LPKKGLPRFSNPFEGLRVDLMCPSAARQNLSMIIFSNDQQLQYLEVLLAKPVPE
jgi:hypothetical protein